MILDATFLEALDKTVKEIQGYSQEKLDYELKKSKSSVLALTIEHLRDPEREGNTSIEWIDASKNLPEKDGKYLTITKGLSYEVNCWSGWRFCFYNDYRSTLCTHWMPLPDAPKELL